MAGSKCCFTGHRYLPDFDSVRIILNKEIKRLILNGTDYFICGGAYGFDMLAGEIVLSLKQLYDITLELALPCREQSKGWTTAQKGRYNYLLQNADIVNYISEEYYDGCMQKRNRYMVDNSECCVAFLTQMRGGTYYTVKYALENDKKVINLANIILTK